MLRLKWDDPNRRAVLARWIINFFPCFIFVLSNSYFYFVFLVVLWCRKHLRVATKNGNKTQRNVYRFGPLSHKYTIQQLRKCLYLYKTFFFIWIWMSAFRWIHSMKWNRTQRSMCVCVSHGFLKVHSNTIFIWNGKLKADKSNKSCLDIRSKVPQTHIKLFSSVRAFLQTMQIQKACIAIAGAISVLILLD